MSTKLGCVTGMDLAQMNRAFLPRWLNIGLWLIAEASIVCTDISQVIIGACIFSLNRVSDTNIGHWNSNSHQPSNSKNTCHSCMWHISSRHPVHPHVLQARWKSAQAPSLRDLRISFRGRYLHHVHHPARPHFSSSRRGIQRLPSISHHLR